MVIHTIHANGLRDAFHLLVNHAAAPMPWAEITAYIVAILLGGRLVARKAWYAARSLRPEINFLMVIAILGAALLGEWLEAASVTFLFALRSEEHTSELQSLMRISYAVFGLKTK